MGDGKVVYDVRADDSKLEGDLERANGKAEKGASKLGNIAKGAMVAVGAAFVAGGAAAFKFGMDFENSIAKTSTLLDTSVVDMDLLNTSLLDLSNKSGVAANELGDALYEALSAGIQPSEDMSEAMSFLESNTRLAKAGFTDITTAIDVTTSIINAYGMSVSETDKIHKILMQTQNLGKTTVAELGTTLSGVTSTASAFGVSFENIGAALSVMTAKGTPTAQAVTQLNMLIAELGKTGSNASKILLEKTGSSFSELLKKGLSLGDILQVLPMDITGLTAKLDELAKGMDNDVDAAFAQLIKDTPMLEAQFIDMFGSIEAAKAAMSMGGTNADSFAKALEAMTTEIDVVGDAFDKVSGTTSEQFKKMLNELKNAAIDLFVEIMPIVQSLLPVLKDLLQKIIPVLSQIVQKILPIFTKLLEKLLPPLLKLVDKVLPVLMKLFDGVSSAIGNIIDQALPILIDLFNELEPIFTDLGGTLLPQLKNLFASLLPPLLTLAKNVVPLLASALKSIIPTVVKIISEILPVITKLLAKIIPLAMQIIEKILPIIIKLVEKLLPVVMQIIEKVLPVVVGLLEKLLPPLFKLIEAILPVIIELFNELMPVIMQIIDSVLPILTMLIDALLPILTMLIDTLTPILELFIALIQPILELVMSALTPLLEILSPIIAVILKLIEEALKPLLENFKAVFAGIIEVVTNLVGGIKTHFENIIDFIKNVFTGNWKGAWDNIKNIFANIWESIKNCVKAPINFIVDGMNKLISGLNKLQIKMPDWLGGKTFGINIPLIPRLKKGKSFVPQDYFPAYLDYGERVMTKEQNIKFNTMGGLEGMERALSQNINSNQSTTIQNHLTLKGDVEMDGFKVGTVVMRNIDDVLKYR